MMQGRYYVKIVAQRYVRSMARFAKLQRQGVLADF